jgi:hypothetical protein
VARPDGESASATLFIPNQDVATAGGVAAGVVADAAITPGNRLTLGAGRGQEEASGFVTLWGYRVPGSTVDVQVG